MTARAIDPADIRTWFPSDSAVDEAEYVLRVSSPAETPPKDDARQLSAARDALEVQAFHAATGRCLETASSRLSAAWDHATLLRWIESFHSQVRDTHGPLGIGDIWLLDDCSFRAHRDTRSPDERTRTTEGPEGGREGVLHLLIALRLLHAVRPTRILALREQLLPFAGLKLWGRVLARLDRELVSHFTRCTAHRRSNQALDRAREVASEQQTIIAAEGIVRASHRRWLNDATSMGEEIDGGGGE